MTAQGVSVNDDRAARKGRPGHRADNWLKDWATALLRLLGLEPRPAGKPGHRKDGQRQDIRATGRARMSAQEIRVAHEYAIEDMGADW